MKKMLIAGEWVDSISGLRRSIVDPGNQEAINSVPESNQSDIKRAIAAGRFTSGQKVMTGASQSIKKTSLELGGKNPNIVFADSEIATAVDGALFAAFANQGEVCSAGSRYGLAAGVWAKDVHRSLRMVREIRAGIVWVNTYHPTYNELPWGGYKRSGIGRELGLYGIEEYLETKQVNFQIDPTPIGWY